MPQKPKFSTVLLILVLVVLAVGLVAAFSSLNQTKQTLSQREQELEAVRTEKSALEQDLEKIRAEKQDLEARLEAMDEEVNILKDNLEKEKALRAPLVAELNTKKKDLETAQRDLERATREKSSLASDLSRVKKDYESTQEVLTQLKQAKEELEKMVKDMMAKKEKEVELGQIVVAPTGGEGKAAAPSAGPLAGQVLSINTEFSFVVISLGRKDGLQPGVTFEVKRDGKPVGKVQVEKVYDRMAAANIVSETKKGAIKKGDQVSQL